MNDCAKTFLLNTPYVKTMFFLSKVVTKMHRRLKLVGKVNKNFI